MLSILTADGRHLKTISMNHAGVMNFGFHPTFGWISEKGAEDRARRRSAHGIATSHRNDWKLKLALESSPSNTWNISSPENCKISKLPSGGWALSSDVGAFHLVPTSSTLDQIAWTSTDGDVDPGSKIWNKAAIAAIIAIIALFAFPKTGPQEVALEVLPEPVQIKIPQTQKVVVVPKSDALTNMMKDAKIENREMKRAVQQNLGFLGLLGKKDLKKALGGMPTAAKDVTAGAGPGGKEGSGGEYLMGLGQGVRRATVGNTGVAGLGGIGTKGAGGGAGGYGNTMVGSGEGRTLSKIALSQEMVLEGGLDRSVIQATIAKYLSQVRACYEEQLQKQAGLAGQVTMNFMIDGQGSVSTAQVGQTSLGNAVVESCIATRMKNWKFPKPVGGVTVKVNYPFLLRPMGT